MINRDKADEYVQKHCQNLFSQTKLIREYAKELKEKYGMPADISNDIFTLRTPINAYSDFDIFCFADVLSNGTVLDKYFTKDEVKTYSKSKYKSNKIKFPLKYKMCQVSNDQWIGKISVKELMQLRDNQLIDYNENTQRTLKHVVNGELDYLVIDIDKKQVRAIEEAFQNETYISDPITLNINKYADINYNEETCELYISPMSGKEEEFKLDIIDGYHRYLAMSNVCSVNNKFDYTMELRIVQFDEDKARQFIWQQDQKHKMKRLDSNSLNQYDLANKIVNRLNTDNNFILKGEVNRNKGIINSAELAGIIDAMFIENKANLSKVASIELEMKCEALLRDRINYMVQTDPKIIAKSWPYKYLVCVIFICQRLDDVPDDQLLDATNILYGETSNEEYKYLYRTKPFSKINFNRLAKIWEEVE